MSSSRKSNRDHAKKQQRPMVEDGVIAQQLEQLLTPAITSLENYYRQLGLRDRILNLPLMVGVFQKIKCPAVSNIYWLKPMI